MLAEQLGDDPSDPIVHYHKLGYGADGTFTVLEEKPATDAAVAALGTALGAKADAAATTDGGTFSLLAFIKRISAALRDGSLKAIMRGAARGETPAADATVTAVSSDRAAVDVYVRGQVGGGLTDAELRADPVEVTVVDGATGAPNVATAQVSVDDTSGGVQVVAARATRRSVTIVNHGDVDVWIGGTGVTVSNGALLLGTKGAALTIATNAVVRAITGGDTVSVGVLEVYD